MGPPGESLPFKCNRAELLVTWSEFIFALRMIQNNVNTVFSFGSENTWLCFKLLFCWWQKAVHLFKLNFTVLIIACIKFVFMWGVYLTFISSAHLHKSSNWVWQWSVLKGQSSGYSLFSNLCWFASFFGTWATDNIWTEYEVYTGTNNSSPTDPHAADALNFHFPSF